MFDNPLSSISPNNYYQLLRVLENIDTLKDKDEEYSMSVRQLGTYAGQKLEDLFNETLVKDEVKYRLLISLNTNHNGDKVFLLNPLLFNDFVKVKNLHSSIVNKQETIHLETKEGYILYEELANVGDWEVEISLEGLRHVMRVKDKYPMYAQFNKTFIQKAVRDINDNLPSRDVGWLETKTVKKGAKIDRLVFSFN